MTEPTFYTYRLRHRRSGYWCHVCASSAQEACGKLGWLIGDVWTSRLAPADRPTGWEDILLQHLPPEKQREV